MMLGVNIDHVATLRQARRTPYPDPIRAAQLVEQAGADSITLHLREDRRHIQDDDVHHLQQSVAIPINLELAVTNEMIAFAQAHTPEYCCLVPEKRQELTTEGGLDVISNQEQITEACTLLSQAGIRVSLFIDASPPCIEAAAAIGAKCVELHTGCYANASTRQEQQSARDKLLAGVELGCQLGLLVHAGHGLHYDNVSEIACIDGISELNIGHSIIARAMFSGLPEAVRTMKQLIQNAS